MYWDTSRQCWNTSPRAIGAPWPKVLFLLYPPAELNVSYLCKVEGYGMPGAELRVFIDEKLVKRRYEVEDDGRWLITREDIDRAFGKNADGTIKGLSQGWHSIRVEHDDGRWGKETVYSSVNVTCDKSDRSACTCPTGTCQATKPEVKEVADKLDNTGAVVKIAGGPSSAAITVTATAEDAPNTPIKYTGTLSYDKNGEYDGEILYADFEGGLADGNYTITLTTAETNGYCPTEVSVFVNVTTAPACTQVSLQVNSFNYDEINDELTFSVHGAPDVTLTFELTNANNTTQTGTYTGTAKTDANGDYTPASALEFSDFGLTFPTTPGQYDMLLKVTSAAENNYCEENFLKDFTFTI